MFSCECCETFNLNLGKGNFTPPLPLPNSEMLKGATLAYCSIQQLFIWDIRTTFGIPNLPLPQSLDIDQNSDGGISNFWISGQSFINENCHNSRKSYDIDMKLGPVTKIDKRNMATSKKIEDHVISANWDVIVFFPIYG